ARGLHRAPGGVPAGLPLLVGCLARNEQALTAGGRPLYNAVALLQDGRARIVARKCLLPTYDVFDATRYFEPFTAPERNVVEIAGGRGGGVVCQDGWDDEEVFAP